MLFRSINLESPLTDKTYQGVGVIRGWALDTDDVESVVATRLTIDGVDQGSVPFGGLRPDVASIYDTFGAEFSGFATTFNYDDLDSDFEHYVLVEMLTTDGNVYSADASFSTTKFLGQKTWIKKADLGFSGFKPVDNGFVLTDVIINSIDYDTVQFGWDNQAQSFEIKGINSQMISQ